MKVCFHGTHSVSKSTKKIQIDSLKSLLYHKQDGYNNEQKMRIALKIYSELNEENRRNGTIINLLLKICLNTSHPEKAVMIWKNIHKKDIKSISYSLFIKCYLKINKSMNECIEILESMNEYQDKIAPKDVKDYSVYISALISKCNTINQVKRIHSLINDSDIYIATALIHTYGHFHYIDNAHSIFDAINDKEKDTVIIGAMMTAFIHNNNHLDALQIYDKYPLLHNDVIHILSIKACIGTNNFKKGQQIHSSITAKDININLKNCLIDFYGYFGDIKCALNIFENGKKDVISINSMMTAFINNGDYNHSLSLYETYQLNDDISDALAIKSCNKLNNYNKGKAIHNQIQSINTHCANALIQFYSNFDDLENAIAVFDSIKDEYTLISMMKCFINKDLNEKALNVYTEICNTIKSETSHILAIKACKNDILHAECLFNAIDTDTMTPAVINTMLNIFIDNDCIDKAIVLYNDYAIVDDITHVLMMGVYYKLRNIEEIAQIYNKIDIQTSFVLNGILKVYIDNGDYNAALLLYDEYESLIDDASNVLAIKACINLNNYKKGLDVECKMKCDTDNIFIQTALIDFYGSFGDIDGALDIFAAINDNKDNIVTINAMMNAYINVMMYRECIDLFYAIETPDCISYAIVLKACTQSTASYIGDKIHEKLKSNKNEWMLSNIDIQINLINFYAKCGKLHICDGILHDIKENEPQKYDTNIAIWNAMMNGYGRNGNITKSKQIFDKIKNEIGLESNAKTFAILLNACNHCGDLKQAIHIWNNEIKDDTMKYDRYVVTSLIDCFCRKGKVNKGKELIIQYETRTHDKVMNQAMWMALLNACKLYNESTVNDIYIEIEKRFQNDEHRMSAASVILSNIYASIH